MKLWGIPFVLMGLYLIVGRFIIDAYIRKRTIYVLTNKSAYILTNVFGRKTAVINLTPNVTMTEKRDGRGTITFNVQYVSRLLSESQDNVRSFPCFEEIERVRDVFAMIKVAQAGNK